MSIDLTVYPDECDAFGHLNQASYLALFERARWELLARGPGMDAFSRAGVWPAVRRAVVDYHAGAWPGDVLRFDVAITHRGRTSFTLTQRATRRRDHRLVATLECVFVCIDQDERPVPVPEAILAALGDEPRRVALPDGGTLAVATAGSGGVPLLLVHGYPFDHGIFAPQLAGITGHRVIAPDLRGFGASSPPTGPMTVDDYADDLAALLDALGLETVVLGGLSLGGYVALAFAARHRARLDGLILLDTRAGADGADGKAARDAAIRLAESEGAEAIATAMAPKLFAEGVDPTVRDTVVAMMRRAPVPGIVTALAAMRDRPDRTALLPTLAGLPTLMLVGTEDRLTPPAETRAMAAAVPGATVIEVEGAGHVPTVERPGTTNEAIQRFLDGRV